MKLPRNDCDSCSHKFVCAWKKNREDLDAELREKTKLLEYREFSAVSVCKHWEQISKFETPNYGRANDV